VGKWLFHCHLQGHVTGDMRAPDMSPADRQAMAHGHHDIQHSMAGLVLGITVLAGDETAAPDLKQQTARHLTVTIDTLPNRYGPDSGFGFTITDPEQPAPDAPPSSDMPPPLPNPSPTLVLQKGEPVAITLVNKTDTETSIHWHGIELESYNDGVAGWSGAGAHLAPMIAPGDSFVATFTPPRAGTFIYHTHMNDLGQMAAGMYGALVVLEPGETWNDTTDHVFAVGQSGLNAPAWTVVNGLPTREPLFIKAGVPHRFRFLSMTLDEETDVSIALNDSVVTWTPVAKDAMPIPAALRTLRPAKLHFGPGETYDFELTPQAGEYHMKVLSLTNVLITIVAE
jgi:FtsP/CotA-like multicopper oxidase with cupredoxin domain